MKTQEQRFLRAFVFTSLSILVAATHSNQAHAARGCSDRLNGPAKLLSASASGSRRIDVSISAFSGRETRAYFLIARSDSNVLKSMAGKAVTSQEINRLIAEGLIQQTGAASSGQAQNLRITSMGEALSPGVEYQVAVATQNNGCYYHLDSNVIDVSTLPANPDQSPTVTVKAGGYDPYIRMVLISWGVDAPGGVLGFKIKVDGQDRKSGSYAGRGLLLWSASDAAGTPFNALVEGIQNVSSEHDVEVHVTPTDGLIGVGSKRMRLDAYVGN